jgi:hypothetical protein
MILTRLHEITGHWIGAIRAEYKRPTIKVLGQSSFTFPNKAICYTITLIKRQTTVGRRYEGNEYFYGCIHVGRRHRLFFVIVKVQGVSDRTLFNDGPILMGSARAEGGGRRSATVHLKVALSSFSLLCVKFREEDPGAFQRVGSKGGPTAPEAWHPPLAEAMGSRGGPMALEGYISAHQY